MADAVVRTASNWRLVVVLSVVFALASFALCGSWALAVLQGDTTATVVLAYWFLLSLASEAFWIETPTRRGMISMSLAVNLASLWVLPLPVAIWVGGASVLVGDLLFHRRRLLRALFNAAQTVLALSACAWLVLDPIRSRGLDAMLLHPLSTASVPLVFAVVNTGLVALVIAFDRGLSPWAAWRDNFGHSYQALSTLGLYLAGLALVAAYEAIGFAAGLGFLLIFLLVRNGYARYVETHGSRDFTGIRG